jgi:hypothetical protein
MSSSNKDHLIDVDYLSIIAGKKLSCQGYSTIISEEDAIAIGVSEFAYKPLNKENIATLVRQVLDR